MVAQLAFMILGLRDFGMKNIKFCGKTDAKINSKIIFLGTFRNESQNLHLKVLEHNSNLRSSIKNVIPHASRDVFSCSPDNYVFGMFSFSFSLQLANR